MITVPLDGTTIPHEIEEKFGALARAAEAGRAGHRRDRRWWRRAPCSKRPASATS